MPSHNIVREINNAPSTTAIARVGGDQTLAILISDGDYTVLAENSGKIHYIANVSADRTFTLPTAAAGLFYEFWATVAAADGHDWIFDTGSDTNYFIGGVIHLDADAGSAGDELVPIASDGNSNSKLQVNLPSVGTVVKMYCDGDQWYLNGYVLSATVPAFADQ